MPLSKLVEQIREGIAVIISDNEQVDGVDVGRAVSGIMAYLHSQGVVMKVDRELPEDWIKGLRGKLNLTDWDYEDLMLYLLRSGYVATEPLIERGNGSQE